MQTDLHARTNVTISVLADINRLREKILIIAGRDKECVCVCVTEVVALSKQEAVI